MKIIYLLPNYMKFFNNPRLPKRNGGQVCALCASKLNIKTLFELDRIGLVLKRSKRTAGNCYSIMENHKSQNPKLKQISITEIQNPKCDFPGHLPFQILEFIPKVRSFPSPSLGMLEKDEISVTKLGLCNE